MTWGKKVQRPCCGDYNHLCRWKGKRRVSGSGGDFDNICLERGADEVGRKKWWYLLYQLSRLSVRWDWTRALMTCLQKYTVNKGVTARTFCLTEYLQWCSLPWARLKKYLHRLQGHSDPNMPPLAWDPAIVKEISDCANTQMICAPHFFIRHLKTNFNQLKDVCKQPSSTLTSNK